MFCSPTDSLLHFLRESIVGTDTLCKKDTMSVSKEDFNALEKVTDEIYDNDINTNSNVITIDITGSLDAPPLKLVQQRRCFEGSDGSSGKVG